MEDGRFAEGDTVGCVAVDAIGTLRREVWGVITRGKKGLLLFLVLGT